MEISLLQDAGEYREGGDAHGDSEEENKGNVADAVRSEADSQRMRQQSGHGEGQQDADAAGGQGGCPLTVKMRGVEIHPNQEEKENEADGGEKLELREGGLGKRSAERCGAKRPKTDGPIRMPPTISPMTRGWPSIAGEAAADHRDQQHDGHLEQQQGHGKNPFSGIFLEPGRLDAEIAEERLIRVYQSGGEKPSATVIFPDDFFAAAYFLKMREGRFVAHLFCVPRKNLKR